MYGEDTDFAEACKVCTNFENHFHSQFFEYIVHNGFLFKGQQLCVPRGSMRENLIQEKHNGSMSGHFGLNKTQDLVERFYYWPKYQRDMRRYVEKFSVCQKEKDTTSNAGIYQPLSAPSRPLECIRMDFIFGLPRTKIVLDSMFMVVEIFCKMSHFIPCKTT